MAGKSIDFTPAALKAALCPEGAKEFIYWCQDLKGFGLRTYPSGRRVWIVQYRNADGVERKTTIGEFSSLPLGGNQGARSRAKNILANARMGGDPQAKARVERRAPTFKELAEAYLGAIEGQRAPKTVTETRRALLRYASPLHRLKAHTITRRHISEVLETVQAGSGNASANRLHAYLSAFYSWAIKTGRVEADNPLIAVAKPAIERPRDRVLTDGEIGRIWRCTTGGNDYDRIVRLLILTAARASEVGSMPWSELQTDGDNPLWVLSATRSKNRLAHEVPLSELAIAQLPSQRGAGHCLFGRSATGFVGWSNCKERLDARIQASRHAEFVKRVGRGPAEGELEPLPGWTLHDLRRTFSTWGNESGIEPHVVEAVLNHASGGARSGVAGVYNKARYRAQKREALTAWEAHVREVCQVPADADRTFDVAA